MGSSQTRGLREGEGSNPSGPPAAAPAKMFPQWSAVEQDFWLDMFETYSETLLNQVPEEEADLRRQIEQAGTQDMGQDEKRTAYFTGIIQLAAKLADEATVEMIYRFERQKPVNRQRKLSGGGDDKDKSRKRRRMPW